MARRKERLNMFNSYADLQLPHGRLQLPLFMPDATFNKTPNLAPSMMMASPLSRKGRTESFT